MRAETDRKILQTCMQIAIMQGIGAVSIEEVAKRSGVAKTTIYRRYRNTEDMLRQVQTLEFARTPELAELSATRPNLQLVLKRIIQHFSSQIGVAVVGMVLSTRNEYFGRIVEQAIVPERRRFADFLRRGEHTGTLRRGLDDAFLFNTIIGSMVANQALADEKRGIGAGQSDTGVPRDSDDGEEASATSTPDAASGLNDDRWAQHMTDLLWPAIAA
jgi:AcrR family transcriptional regulator